MRKAASWVVVTGLASSGALGQFRPGLNINAVSSSEGRGMLREAGPVEDLNGLITEADFRSFAPADTRHLERAIELTVDERDAVSNCHDAPVDGGAVEKTPLCRLVVERTRFRHALTSGGQKTGAKVRLFFQFWFNPPGAAIPPPPAPPSPPAGWKAPPADVEPAPRNPGDLKLGIKGDFPLPKAVIGVLPDGRGIGCKIIKSSDDDSIDIRACEKVVRMRFTPATDGYGHSKPAVAVVQLQR